jgi:hypothetical protein
MQYMLLIYTDPAAGLTPGTPEFMDMLARYGKANETYQADGVYKAGDALQPPSTATTVKVRGGKVQTMDGPFAETKEMLAGYYLLDCKDLDAAIKYAAMIPGAEIGSIEVRPVVDLTKFR